MQELLKEKKEIECRLNSLLYGTVQIREKDGSKINFRITKKS